MPDELLPLFPLGLVLLPGTPLPLHIFEDRYKEMIGEAIRSESEFGVVLATGQGIANVGTTAVVSEVIREYPDGRLDVLCSGRRRFQLMSLNEERSYLRGEVRFFADEDFADPPFEEREKALMGYRSVRKLIEDAEAAPDPDLASPLLSFRLAQIIPDLDLKQVLLTMRSESDRIARLAEYFPTFAERREITARIREVAPRNGHGKHLGGLPQSE